MLAPYVVCAGSLYMPLEVGMALSLATVESLCPENGGGRKQQDS